MLFKIKGDLSLSKRKRVIVEPEAEVQVIQEPTHSTLDEIIQLADTVEVCESDAPKIHYLRLLLAKLKTETT
jgi:hypothetical protein